jgi:hypothetical protein
MDAAGIGFILGFGLLFGGAALYSIIELCIQRRRKALNEASHLLEQTIRPRVIPKPKHWKINTLFVIGKPNINRQNGQRKIIVLR